MKSHHGEQDAGSRDKGQKRQAGAAGGDEAEQDAEVAGEGQQESRTQQQQRHRQQQQSRRQSGSEAESEGAGKPSSACMHMHVEIVRRMHGPCPSGLPVCSSVLLVLCSSVDYVIL